MLRLGSSEKKLQGPEEAIAVTSHPDCCNRACVIVDDLLFPCFKFFPYLVPKAGGTVCLPVLVNTVVDQCGRWLVAGFVT